MSDAIHADWPPEVHHLHRKMKLRQRALHRAQASQEPELARRLIDELENDLERLREAMARCS